MRKPSPAHRLLTLAALLAALPAAAAPDNITGLGAQEKDLNTSWGEAKSANKDGSIIIGILGKATVWSGSNWQTKTHLEALGANGYVQDVGGISADGKVIVGESIDDNSRVRPTVWFGSGWQTKTDLGTLMDDNSGAAAANAVSGDGRVIVGESNVDPRFGAGFHATAWWGDNWQDKVDLGTPNDRNWGNSYAHAVNADGSVIVGHSDTVYSERGIVWSGDRWQTKTVLGTLDNNDYGASNASAVSADGRIVVGYASSGNDIHAVVWSGDNWQTKTDLGTWKAGNSGTSFARAVSSDGSVVAGQAENGSGEYRATVWSGSGWKTMTDLGTLKGDNSGESDVNGISADGIVAVGYSSNDDNVRRPVAWNLRNLNARPTDTANTRASLSLLSADTASLLAQRGRAAENLLGGCRADGGKFCYSAGYRRDIGHGASSRGADFAFGYGISDNFDAAVSLAVPARAEENGSHRLKSGVGIGLSARFHNGTGWYAVPAAAFETDKTRIRRPHLDGTESPENTIRTKGRAYSLTAGRDYGTSGEKTLGWYAALRRTEAERPSYSEDAGLSFPFAYGAAKLKETSLAAGIKGRLPLTGKLAWYGNAEVAQRVGGGKARFTAEAPFFGKYETERETSRTRPSVQTGVDYAFSPSAVLSLGGYIGRNAFSGTDKGMFLKLNGKF